MTREHVSKAQAYKAELDAAKATAEARVVVTLTKQQYKVLEQRFPMRQDTTDPIQAAVQLGQQMVLRALRDGLVVE